MKAYLKTEEKRLILYVDVIPAEMDGFMEIFDYRWDDGRKVEFIGRNGILHGVSVKISARNGRESLIITTGSGNPDGIEEILVRFDNLYAVNIWRSDVKIIKLRGITVHTIRIEECMKVKTLEFPMVIRTLRIERCNVSSVAGLIKDDADLPFHSFLEEVSFAYNKITDFPSDWLDVPAMRYLNLSHNKITKIPNFSKNEFTIIDLSFNRIGDGEHKIKLPSIGAIIDLHANPMTSPRFKIKKSKYAYLHLILGGPNLRSFVIDSGSRSVNRLTIQSSPNLTSLSGCVVNVDEINLVDTDVDDMNYSEKLSVLEEMKYNRRKKAENRFGAVIGYYINNLRDAGE